MDLFYKYPASISRTKRAITCFLYLVFCSSVTGITLERFPVRPVCYKQTQPKGCSKTLLEAYPSLSKSFTGVTPADTHLYLFTIKNKEEPENLHKCAADLPPETNFMKDCPVLILFPGYASGICNFAIYRELKNQALEGGCINVILLDWMWGNGPDLIPASENMKIAVAQLAILVKNLKKRGVRDEDITCTGHSYGAHACGQLGQKEHIGKIIGLDPAGGPYAESDPLDIRLDPGDADCVEVYHCNAGQCIPFFFGANFTSGTVDYWFNDGLNQPSCFPQTLISFLKGDIIYGLFSLIYPACQHFQCLQYYKVALNPKSDPFIGFACDSLEDFKSGKCSRSCGPDGENCTVLGRTGCECLTAKQKAKPYPRNYYFDTSLLCPYTDNSKVDIDGFKCSANTTTKAYGKRKCKKKHPNM